MPYNYFVSGRWATATGISHLLLHKNGTNGFEPGMKTRLAAVLDLLGTGQTLAIIVWDYSVGQWRIVDAVAISVSSGTGHPTLQGATNPTCFERLVDMHCLDTDRAQVPLIRTGLHKKSN